MKLAKNPAFLHNFSKFRGILLFVLKYIYISLFLKLMGFPDQRKIMTSPFNYIWTNYWYQHCGSTIIFCLFLMGTSTRGLSKKLPNVDDFGHFCSDQGKWGRAELLEKGINAPSPLSCYHWNMNFNINQPINPSIDQSIAQTIKHITKMRSAISVKHKGKCRTPSSIARSTLKQQGQNFAFP